MCVYCIFFLLFIACIFTDFDYMSASKKFSFFTKHAHNVIIQQNGNAKLYFIIIQLKINSLSYYFNCEYLKSGDIGKLAPT